MNIFYLSNDVNECVKWHNNAHCVKMILESCQLLSTAHRLLDGVESFKVNKNGRKVKFWQLNNDRENIIYAATHINHPSAVWVRSGSENYLWLARMTDSLCKEYTYRYEKIHKCESSGLVSKLQELPKNIRKTEFTEPTPAMPDIYKVKGDSIASYRNYYNGAKQHLSSWKKREVPHWFNISNS